MSSASEQNIIIVSLKQCKKAFKWLFLFGLAINIMMIFMPIYTMQVLDRVVSSGSLETLCMLTLITVAAFLCIALLDLCRNSLLIGIGDLMDEKAAPTLLRKSIAARILSGSNNAGDALRDLNTIKSFIASQHIFSVFDAPWSLLYLALLFMIHPATGALSIFGIIIMISLAIWNEKATHGKVSEISNQHIKNIMEIDTANRNAETIEAMGMSSDIIDAWSKKNTHLRHMQLMSGGRAHVIQAVTKFARMILQISAIGLGTFLAIRYQKSPGGIIAGSILMGRAMAPFESAIITWKNFTNARTSYKRLSALLTRTVDREESMELPAPLGAVTFDKAIFIPPASNKPVIKGVSFAVPPGATVGIIGPSAAGKSTLVKMTVGIWAPASGQVLLDGCSAYRWPRHLFKQYVGYLPQNVELFNASIKQNIARMNNNPDPAMVIKAAQIAGMHEAILSMPKGYETVLGERGSELSGGQRQRIGIARAFYGDIRLVALDEPNSNLDQAGELALIQAINYAKKNNITLLITTHKISILAHVDKILVMHDGMVAAYGNRDDIMKKGGEPQQQSPKEAIAQQERAATPASLEQTT